MAGMGRHNIGLPLQFAAAFSFNRKFAVCLTSGRGVAFFGNGPYVFLPGIQISRLQKTPLLINPGTTVFEFSKGEKSPEYFIGVTAIKIVEKTLPIDPTLLKINASTGIGGTKISSVNPYTVLESSIYKAFTSEFIRQAAARSIKRVASVKPFGIQIFGFIRFPLRWLIFNVFSLLGNKERFRDGSCPLILLAS
jgi:hypothetical protein